MISSKGFSAIAAAALLSAGTSSMPTKTVSYSSTLTKKQKDRRYKKNKTQKLSRAINRK